MLILNSDREYVKLVNTMTRQRDTVTAWRVMEIVFSVIRQ